MAPKLQRHVLFWFSGLSNLKNNILKVGQNCDTGSHPNMTSKKMTANGQFE